jgi:hypothetical protein
MRHALRFRVRPGIATETVLQHGQCPSDSAARHQLPLGRRRLDMVRAGGLLVVGWLDRKAVSARTSPSSSRIYREGRRD